MPIDPSKHTVTLPGSDYLELVEAQKSLNEAKKEAEQTKQKIYANFAGIMVEYANQCFPNGVSRYVPDVKSATEFIQRKASQQ